LRGEGWLNAGLAKSGWLKKSTTVFLKPPNKENPVDSNGSDMDRNSGSVGLGGAEGSGPARIGAGIGSRAVGLGPAGVGAGIDGGAVGLGPADAVVGIDGRLGSDQQGLAAGMDCPATTGDKADGVLVCGGSKPDNTTDSLEAESCVAVDAALKVKGKLIYLIIYQINSY